MCSSAGVENLVKARCAVATPSLAVTVMVARPDWSAAGASESTRNPPLPPTPMPLAPISALFDDAAPTFRLPAGLSTSLTVKETDSG